METFEPRIVYCCSETSPEAKGTKPIRASGPDAAVAVVESGEAELCVLFAAEVNVSDLCRRIREIPLGALLPIVVVGGHETEVENLEASLKIGADAFLDQADLEMLPEKIETLLGMDVDSTLPSRPPPVPEDSSKLILEASESSDPVEDALRLARSVSSKNPSSYKGVSFTTSHEQSLKDVVREMEQHLDDSKDGAIKTTESQLSEGLDTLDVEAYLDRPAAVDDAVLQDEGDESAIGSEVTPVSSSNAIGTDEEQENVGIGFEEQEEAPTVNENLAQLPDTFQLKEMPVWEVLAAMLSNRASGVLVLEFRGIVRRVFFEDGEPLLAVSSAREDRLTELLFREGRLTEQQYELASMTVGVSGRRVGAVLVEKGFISSRELFPLVRHHYETLIFDSFSWREGTWRFEDGKPRISERILLDLPAAGLIVEGIRSRAEPEDVDRIVPPGAKLTRLEEGICPLESTGMSPSELEILEWCDGNRTVDELALRFGLHSYEIRTIAMGLNVLGWVKVDGGDVSRSGQEIYHQRTQDQSSNQEIQIERARVKEKMIQVEEGNYFAIIEITPEASGHEIRKAYRRLRGVYALERFAALELADLQAEVEVIRFVVEEAYEILRNPALREAYRQAQGAEG